MSIPITRNSTPDSNTKKINPDRIQGPRVVSLRILSEHKVISFDTIINQRIRKTTNN